MRTSLFNTISIIFLLLTVGVILFVGWQFTQPVSESSGNIANLPTERVLPSSTPEPPTETLRPTLPPTFTNTPTSTVSPTNTVPPTNTIPPTDTITPSPTITDTAAPTDAVTPTSDVEVVGDGGNGGDPGVQTPTPSGPTATLPPTAVPFLYDLDGEVLYTQNNTSTGCAWQGMGGSVLDSNGAEIAAQYQVRVFDGQGFEQVVNVGTNTFYGQFSGWEVQVANSVSTQTYFARLETIFNTQISPRVEVTFPGDCTGNLAFVRFRERTNAQQAQPGQPAQPVQPAPPTPVNP